ncbi:hypothetical protein [Gleimia hominis]|uniref:hypothetical protein n=1 Tax=Gleimia hominis TaxID=595468 RepID=UPI000C7FF067|nr:hypothetical protein [Gleimia hominis]WIK64113.1 hypothetical protein CJ187_007350 [Gleimia hominis]
MTEENSQEHPFDNASNRDAEPAPPPPPPPSRPKHAERSDQEAEIRPSHAETRDERVETSREHMEPDAGAVKNEAQQVEAGAQNAAQQNNPWQQAGFQAQQSHNAQNTDLGGSFKAGTLIGLTLVLAPLVVLLVLVAFSFASDNPPSASTYFGGALLLLNFVFGGKLGAELVPSNIDPTGLLESFGASMQSTATVQVFLVTFTAVAFFCAAAVGKRVVSRDPLEKTAQVGTAIVSTWLSAYLIYAILQLIGSSLDSTTTFHPDYGRPLFWLLIIAAVTVIRVGSKTGLKDAPGPNKVVRAWRYCKPAVGTYLMSSLVVIVTLFVLILGSAIIAGESGESYIALIAATVLLFVNLLLAAPALILGTAVTKTDGDMQYASIWGLSPTLTLILIVILLVFIAVTIYVRTRLRGFDTSWKSYLTDIAVFAVGGILAVLTFSFVLDGMPTLATELLNIGAISFKLSASAVLILAIYAAVIFAVQSWGVPWLIRNFSFVSNLFARIVTRPTGRFFHTFSETDLVVAGLPRTDELQRKFESVKNRFARPPHKPAPWQTQASQDSQGAQAPQEKQNPQGEHNSQGKQGWQGEQAPQGKNDLGNYGTDQPPFEEPDSGDER